MALITCKECGKEYSDKSSTCIHCGSPTDYNLGVYKEDSNASTKIISNTDRRKLISILIRLLSIFYIIRIIALSSLANAANEVINQYGRAGATDITYFLNHPSFDSSMIMLKGVFIGSSILFAYVAYLLYKSNLENKKIYYILCIIISVQYGLSIFGINNAIGPKVAYALIHIFIVVAAILIIKYEQIKRVRVEMIIVIIISLIGFVFSSIDYSLEMFPVVGLKNSFNAEITIVVIYIIIANLFAGTARKLEIKE